MAAFAQALYLFAPLLLSAALAGVVQRLDLLRCLRRPIDGGKTLGGRRWFGDSKTWRGAVVAVVGCIAGAAMQKYGLQGCIAEWLALVDYERVNVFAFGGSMGAGATLGELPNSWVKRRSGIPPGQTSHGPRAALFYLWDQIDLLTTAWPAIWPWTRTSVAVIAASFAIGLAIHPALSLIGYLMGARKSAR